MKNKQPVMIDLEPAKGKDKKANRPTPADVPPVIEPDVPIAQTSAMEAATRFATRKPSRFTRLFWGVVISLLGLMISVAFWDFVTDMMARNLWLGRVAMALTGLFLLGLIFFGLRELAAFARLRRIDDLCAASEAALSSDNLQQARGFSDRLGRLYRGRRDLRWAFAKVSEQGADILDADAHLDLLENTVVAELDKQAVKQIEVASRQVATATAIIPLALVDVIVALIANIRMTRRIAEIYGGRSGIFGSWRLLRAVASHLVATGAVAIGDDMIGTIAGGGVVSKLSRRFGEGIINGALTARVGVAAMEVCRPMPFKAAKKPSVTGLMKRALTGFVGKSG